MDRAEEKNPEEDGLGISDCQLDQLDAKGRAEIEIATILRPLSPLDRLRVVRSVAASMGFGLDYEPALLKEAE